MLGVLNTVKTAIIACKSPHPAASSVPVFQNFGSPPHLNFDYVQSMSG